MLYFCVHFCIAAAVAAAAAIPRRRLRRPSSMLTIAENVEPNNRVPILWALIAEKIKNRIQCVGKGGLPSMAHKPVCNAYIVECGRFLPQDIDITHSSNASERLHYHLAKLLRRHIFVRVLRGKHQNMRVALNANHKSLIIKMKAPVRTIPAIFL